MKEEFKAFVRTKPELVSYVSKGDMTWQKFYEIWNLYGNDDKVWGKYKTREEPVQSNANTDSFNLSSIIDSIKNMDMETAQKGINGMQKAIELLQGFTTGGAASSAAGEYKPRQLFKKFED